MKFTQIESPAVSSPEYYPTPASNADVIRKPLLAGRHLIILNISGNLTSMFGTAFHSIQIELQVQILQIHGARGIRYIGPIV
jgi:hypothetical protein